MAVECFAAIGLRYILAGRIFISTAIEVLALTLSRASPDDTVRPPLDAAATLTSPRSGRWPRTGSLQSAALDDGWALPASAGVGRPASLAATASSHLASRPTPARQRRARGGERYYRLSGPKVARLTEALEQVAPVKPVRSLRQDTGAGATPGLHRYDHLAGRLASS